MARSLSSEQAAEMLVLPQLRELVSERLAAQWRFPEAALVLGRQLIADIASGAFSA